jgi:hypothetical protein
VSSLKIADRTILSQQTGQNCPPISSKDPPYDLFEKESIPPQSPTPRSKATKENEDFEAFWLQYPRKEKKPKARKAYVAARRKADASTILAGCLRYAAEREGEDQKFTDHPATWLNQERWAETPLKRHRHNGHENTKSRLGDLSRTLISTEPELVRMRLINGGHNE